MSTETPKKRILFIDDERINLLGARSVFGREYEVYTATSAREGMNIIEQTPMDAVVSDQRMPEMKGTDLFAAVPDRRRTGARLILTGYSDDEEIRNALDTGIVDAVLEKPLQIADLVGRIDKNDKTLR